MIHVAVHSLAEPSPEGETEQVFASVDGGKTYLPITRYPEPDDESRIAELFEGDGNFKPMVWDRRAMDAWWWGEDKVTKVDHTVVGI
jgi:hypothetical protein